MPKQVLQRLGLRRPTPAGPAGSPSLSSSQPGPGVAQPAASHPHSTPGQRLDAQLQSSAIAPLLNDDSINDILINGPHEIFIGRAGMLEKTDIQFPSRQALHALAEAISAYVARPIDPRRPLVDARLGDGSRVNIIAPPMAVNGMVVSIRKFPKVAITMEMLQEKGSVSPQMAEFLKMCAEARLSLIVSGGTGTGKTTMLNAISRFIPARERIVTIEDTAELRLQQPHVVKLETKEPIVWGAREEEVNAADLVRNALRMRPDRIIVGEIRGEEAYDMIQAMNTGHDGSMSTVHANTGRDALMRIENLLGPRMRGTPAISVRRQLVSALNMIVQLGYGANGHRLITQIAEIVGMENDVITTQDIFTTREERQEDGSLRILQQWTGIVPRHAKLGEVMRASPVFMPAESEAQGGGFFHRAA